MINITKYFLSVVQIYANNYRKIIMYPQQIEDLTKFCTDILISPADHVRQ